MAAPSAMGVPSTLATSVARASKAALVRAGAAHSMKSPLMFDTRLFNPTHGPHHFECTSTTQSVEDGAFVTCSAHSASVVTAVMNLRLIAN